MYLSGRDRRYFIIYHTRFENRGEEHEVRVHQMFFNEDGWPVIAPYRYTEESLKEYTKGRNLQEIINLSIMAERFRQIWQNQMKFNFARMER